MTSPAPRICEPEIPQPSTHDPAPDMRIVGIDPGSRYTGYGIIKKDGQHYEHIASGRINATSGKTFAHRLQIIYRGLQGVLAEWPVDAAAIETIFTAHNVRSTIKLGQARGVALLAIHHIDLEIHEYSPAEVKKNVVGHGRATKQQIQRMVKMRLDFQGHLTEDAADALAIALCYGQASDFDKCLQR